MTHKGIFYLSLSVVAFAFNHIVDKIGMNVGVDPYIFTTFRILVALIFTGLIWISFKNRKHLSFSKKYIKNLVVIGILVSGIGPFLSVAALSFTTATNRGVIFGMGTAVTMLFSYFMLRERLPKLFYPVLFGMVSGLILLTSKGLVQLPNIGDWMLFATLPLGGFCIAYAKKTMKGLRFFTVSLGRLLFGFLFLLLLFPIYGFGSISTIQNGLLWVIAAGLLNGLRILSFYRGIESEGPTLAVTFLAATPAVTAIAAFFILGETLNILQTVGMILILAGALFLTRMKAQYHEVETMHSN